MRKPTVRAGELHIYYGKVDRWDSPDVIYHSGEGIPRCDRAFAHYAMGSDRMVPCLTERSGFKFEPSFLAEMESRGYDLTTLRFVIRKKKGGGEA